MALHFFSSISIFLHLFHFCSILYSFYACKLCVRFISLLFKNYWVLSVFAQFSSAFFPKFSIFLPFHFLRLQIVFICLNLSEPVEICQKCQKCQNFIRFRQISSDLVRVGQIFTDFSDSSDFSSLSLFVRFCQISQIC